MFYMSNFKSRATDLESLVRTAVKNRELAPGVAAQVNSYRTSRLTCEEKRLLAILDDAIASGCIIPVYFPARRVYQVPAYRAR